MLDLKDLQCFLAVYEEGGFVHAARALGVAQSAVSNRVRRLEEVLDAKLFDRYPRNRSGTPTAKGEQFYSYARRVLDHANEAETVMRVKPAA